MNFNMFETGLLVLLTRHTKHIECLLVGCLVHFFKLDDAISQNTEVFAKVHLEITTSI